MTVSCEVAIQLRGAGLRHGQVRALDAVNLRICQGERVAIIGPSGAGKSSLLHLMATAIQPSSGRLGQWGVLRGLLNLVYPSDVPGARQVLAELGLADKLFVQCGQLSGGQLQRVGIARALYQQPQLLLTDEPVSAMDPVLADHSLALLNRHAQAHGITLVASLHAVELALAHFPRVVGIREGQVVFDCPAQAVTEQLLDALYANEQLVPAPPQGPTLTVQIPRC